MRARVAFPIVLLALSCAVEPARAAGSAWTVAPGEYYSELRAGWFSSDIYYDDAGGKRFLKGGGLVEERSLVSYNELGWRPRLSFIVGIPLKSVTRRFGAAAGDRILPTATGLGDALLGVRWRIAGGRTAMALELDWRAPLGYEREPFVTRADAALGGDFDGDGDSLGYGTTRELSSPMLGEGQQDFSLALHLGTAIPRGFAQVSGGYKYRTERPVDQIVLGADLGFWIMRSLLLAGRYEGEVANGDAPNLADLADPDRTLKVQRHRVGPTLLFRVDDNLDLFAATMHTASAHHALHTDEVYVGVTFKQTKLNRFQGFQGSTATP